MREKSRERNGHVMLGVMMMMTRTTSGRMSSSSSEKREKKRVDSGRGVDGRSRFVPFFQLRGSDVQWMPEKLESVELVVQGRRALCLPVTDA